MITVSLCMIVRDEEETIGRCLSTVRDLVDEIIIVDTGSVDRTKEICASFDARIFDFQWINHFAAARNYAFEKARMDYIFWLDADDVLEEVDRLRFQKLKERQDFAFAYVSMPYHLTLDEKGQPIHYQRRNRLVRRQCQFVWHGAVHEYLEVSGNGLHSDISITHRKMKPYSDRNLQIYLNRKERGEVFEPRDQYYFANELYDHERNEKAAEQYQVFLDSGMGWVEDRIAACYKQATCYGRLNQPDKQIQSLVRSLAYDTPRAELCCRLGAFFADKLNFQQAIYWYRQATMLERPQEAMGMTDESAWTWLPHLQLCYCYDRIGDIIKAKIHHEMAKMYNPNHPSVLYNEAYFAGRNEQHSSAQ